MDERGLTGSDALAVSAMIDRNRNAGTGSPAVGSAVTSTVAD